MKIFRKSIGYYINIEKKENMWHFQLWYRGKQAMGNSIGYKDTEKCKMGLKDFQKFLLDTPNIMQDKKLLKIEEIQDDKYVYKFFDTKGNLLYYSRGIEKECNCRKSAESTYNNLPNITEIDRIKIIKK